MTVAIILSSALLALVLAIALVLPSITSPAMPFGVRVPPQHAEDPTALRQTRLYRWRVLLVGIANAAAGVAVYAVTGATLVLPLSVLVLDGVWSGCFPCHFCLDEGIPGHLLGILPSRWSRHFQPEGRLTFLANCMNSWPSTVKRGHLSWKMAIYRGTSQLAVRCQPTWPHGRKHIRLTLRFPDVPHRALLPSKLASFPKPALDRAIEGRPVCEQMMPVDASIARQRSRPQRAADLMCGHQSAHMRSRYVTRSTVRNTARRIFRACRQDRRVRPFLEHGDPGGS